MHFFSFFVFLFVCVCVCVGGEMIVTESTCSCSPVLPLIVCKVIKLSVISSQAELTTDLPSLPLALAIVHCKLEV